MSKKILLIFILLIFTFTISRSVYAQKNIVDVDQTIVQTAAITDKKLIKYFAEDFMNTDAVTLARDNMPIITFVSSHILEFMIAISFTMLLALYGRTSRGGF